MQQKPISELKIILKIKQTFFENVELRSRSQTVPIRKQATRFDN